jgi:quercetin dioxygenase-like cupin family protein
MYNHATTKQLALLGATLLLAACADDTPPPTGPAEMDASMAALHGAAHHGTPGPALQATDPFTFRAPLDPYRIQQRPDFMIQSKARTDIVFQRSVFAPGAGPWHTHPGPSFVYVLEGQIKLQRSTKKDGCIETPVFGPGSTYFEVADEVHRAVVVSSASAVVLVTRFNIPIGGAITIPARDPGC